jgi:16S rRNA (guanine527-N7)-methyltransferase
MVSRETLIRSGLAEFGLTPDGDAVRRLARYAELLEEVAIPRGFIGPAESLRTIPRHILECAALAPFVVRPGPLMDVGSGAGLPGIVLACLGLEPIMLIEAQARRGAFLREVAQHLDLDVEVVHGRAEVLARGDLRENAASVTARAIAEPVIGLELTLPLTRVGGRVLMLLGPISSTRREALDAASEVLGAEAPEVRGFDVAGLDEGRWVAIVRKVRETPDRYPRAPRAMRRRPLGIVLRE